MFIVLRTFARLTLPRSQTTTSFDYDITMYKWLHINKLGRDSPDFTDIRGRQFMYSIDCTGENSVNNLEAH